MKKKLNKKKKVFFVNYEGCSLTCKQSPHRLSTPIQIQNRLLQLEKSVLACVLLGKHSKPTLPLISGKK